MTRASLVVGQSGGPTPVINASLAGVIAEAQKQSGIDHIYGMKFGIAGSLRGEFVDLTSIDETALARLKATPSSALGSCRYKVQPHDYKRLVATFRERNIGYFAYTGGNDSMDTANRIGRLADTLRLDLRVAGVPKTIDNDLEGTDHSPGYGSAARFIALAAMCAGRDLEAMQGFDRVVILECMGRDSGFLTAAAALGRRSPEDAPHLIYLPECPFDEAEFLASVQSVHDRLGRVFVAVCEGIRDRQGELIAAHLQDTAADAFGHQLVTLGSGVAHYLAGRVKAELDLQARHIKCDTVQRSFAPTVSETDREEAWLAGREAVRNLCGGCDRQMVALERPAGGPYRCDFRTTPLETVANAKRAMPPAFIAPSGVDVTPQFIQYAAPLIGDPLPEFVRLV